MGSKTSIETLVRVSTLINSSLDMTTVMDNAMHIVEEHLCSEASSIYELDTDKGELTFRLARGEKAGKIKEKRLKLGEGIVGRVAAGGEPIIVKDTASDSRFLGRFDKESGFTTKSILCVPLKTKDRLLGAIELLNKKGHEGFTDDDLELMTILANQIAIALENASLYQRLQEKFELTAEELKATQEELLRSERLAALGRLSQGIAHEVRNPVMVIGGFTKSLQQSLPRDHAMQEKLSIILKEAERLQNMVKDIETYTRLREPVPSPLSLAELLKEILSDNTSLTFPDTVTVIPDFPCTIPPVSADKELLALSFRHILENSLEAMAGGGTLTITLEPKAYQTIVRFTDTGCGIKPEELSLVFEPFHTSKTRGSGMGLTFVHRIITAHSGEVSMDSVPGKGTTVTVILPHNMQQV